MDKRQSVKKVELTVKRPNGKIEVVVHPTLKFLSVSQFKQIQDDTAKAGRGEVISYALDGRVPSIPTLGEIKAASVNLYKDRSQTAVNRAAISDMSAGGE